MTFESIGITSAMGEMPAISETPSSHFRLEIDRLDTRPFSASFSGYLGSDETGESVPSDRNAPLKEPKTIQDMSYDIENLTNVKAIAPGWGDDVDEIVILSPKAKHLTAADATVNDEVSDFKILYDLADNGNIRTTLVRSSASGKLCVLKRMRKATAHSGSSVPYDWPEHIILEILKLKKIPFVVNLQTSFEDNDFFNLVMDYHPGGDLLSCIARGGPLQPHRVLSFSSEIAQGIAALHALGIIHRNIRAENVMIDSQGHIVLTGFGHAECRTLNKGSGRRVSHSDLGESQPPELILGWKHDFAVDCWGFGILLFIMQVGKHPFSNLQDSRNIDAVKQSIIRDPVPFHLLSHVTSVAQDLVLKCLERNPALRMNIQQIQSHEYFSTTKWKSFAMETESGKGDRTGPSDEPGASCKDHDLLHAHSSNLLPKDPSTNGGVGTWPSSLQSSREREPETALSSRRITKHNSMFCDVPSVADSIGRDTVLDITALRSASRATTIEEKSASEIISPPRGDKFSSVVHPWKPSSTGSTRMSSTKASCKLRKKIRSIQTFSCSPDQDPRLPKGVEQRGKGIGFTVTFPPANQSVLTVCSTTPGTCYGSFWRGLSFGSRKRNQHIISQASSDVPDCVEAPDLYRCNSNDSFPGVLSPFLNSSPISDTAVNTPTSVGTVE